MRLLNVDSLEFAVFPDDSKPPYIAASHRWLPDGETTFQDVRDFRNTNSKGHQKVLAFAKYLRETVPSINWLWLDSCCINKDSAAELSEAINSMFDWYHDATLCLVYLADVDSAEDLSAFDKSEWFRRGWTLQELLAPPTVIFVTDAWQLIGHKGGSVSCDCLASIGPDLGQRIAQVTGIPEQVLRGYEASSGFSVDEKLRWMEGRVTTRPEDMSYALYGILEVTLGANYGEKFEGAKQRLLAAIRQRENLAVQQAEIFEKITRWLSPPDPWTNHESARQRHEPETGAWLLQHQQYQAWKSGSTKILWIYGKAGCGKTILCSTAIEDIRTYSKSVIIGQGIFYFSFSDSYKQTYKDMLTSLVVQLGWKEPGLSMLSRAYKGLSQRQLGTDEPQMILLSCINSYDKVFLHVDGLDECRESDGVRQDVLDRIESLMEQAPGVRMLVTSRDVPDVRQLLETLAAESISAAAPLVNPDIQKYILTQISRDRKLSQLDLATKTMVQETLARRADGMFRWVYCQLQELKKSKSTRPKSVKAALLALPATLDETYERMLNNIAEEDRSYALKLLRWVAYAKSPPSLNELVEASIIDPNEDPALNDVVDIEDRGGWGDTLEILAGLVITETADEVRTDSDISWTDAVHDDDSDLDGMHIGQRINKYANVRLAHFSVKEYLESSRIQASSAADFYLDPAEGHRFLTQSCLVYLLHYSNNFGFTSTAEAFTALPLLSYAAHHWYRHAWLQRWSSSTRELSLLNSKDSKRDWLKLYDPDLYWWRHVTEPRDVGDALYHASLLGLEAVVEQLLYDGADSSTQGGRCGNALQAASYQGREKVFQMLLNAGADVNLQGGFYGNALQAASYGGNEKIVQLLVAKGVNVNARGGAYPSALHAASDAGHEEVVRTLLKAGANLDAQEEDSDNVLQLASAHDRSEVVQTLSDAGFFDELQKQERRWEPVLQIAVARGHEEVARLLVEAGADVNAQDHELAYSNALQAASYHGYPNAVQMLLDAGANVNAQGGYYGDALQAAVSIGHEHIVRLLLDAGADVSSHPRGGIYGSALQAASFLGHDEIVQVLLDARADVNAQLQRVDGCDALRLASCCGYEKIARMLIDAGADVNFQREPLGNALHWASFFGNTGIVRMLIDAGADVNAQDGFRNVLQDAAYEDDENIVRLLLDTRADANAQTQGGNYDNALQAASAQGHETIVQLLLSAGADVNAQTQGEKFGNALEAAVTRGHEEIVRMLLEAGAHDTRTKGKSASSPSSVDEAYVGLQE